MLIGPAEPQGSAPPPLRPREPAHWSLGGSGSPPEIGLLLPGHPCGLILSSCSTSLSVSQNPGMDPHCLYRKTWRDTDRHKEKRRGSEGGVVITATKVATELIGLCLEKKKTYIGFTVCLGSYLKAAGLCSVPVCLCVRSMSHLYLHTFTVTHRQNNMHVHNAPILTLFFIF